MTNKLMFKMSNQRVYRAVNCHIFCYMLHMVMLNCCIAIITVFLFYVQILKHGNFMSQLFCSADIQIKQN